MRKIVGPHNVVLAPPFQIMAADGIVEETGIHLVTDKLAGVFRDRWRILLAEAVVVVVPLLNDPGQPAAFVFYRYDLEFRIPFQDAIENQLEEAVGDVHELQVNAAPVTFDAFSFLCCNCGPSKCASSRAYPGPGLRTRTCHSG